MSFIEYLRPDAARALRAGRAIPFLIDYRPPELSAFKFSVVGTLDDLRFYTTIYDEAPPSTTHVDDTIFCPPLFVANVDLPTEEARATHALWSMWTTGVRDSLMQYLSALGQAVALQSLPPGTIPAASPLVRGRDATRRRRKGKGATTTPRRSRRETRK